MSQVVPSTLVSLLLSLKLKLYFMAGPIIQATRRQVRGWFEADDFPVLDAEYI